MRIKKTILIPIILLLHTVSLNADISVKTSSGDNPSCMLDSSINTRWSSDARDNQWIEFDLGEIKELAGIQINWEDAYGAEYKIFGSQDSKNWKLLRHIKYGMGDIEVCRFNIVSKVKYVRIELIKRGTMFGFSIWECNFLTKGEIDKIPAPKWKSDPNRTSTGRIVMSNDFDKGLNSWTIDNTVCSMVEDKPKRFGNITLLTSDEYDTDSFLGIDRNGKYISPAIKYNGEKLEVTFWMRFCDLEHSDNGWERVGLQIYTLNAAGKPFTDREISYYNYPNQSSKSWLDYTVGVESKYTKLNRWTRYTRRFVFSKNVKYIRIGCFANNCSRGKTYFDNLEVIYSSLTPDPVKLTVNTDLRVRSWTNFYNAIDDGPTCVDYVYHPSYEHNLKKLKSAGFKYMRIGETHLRVKIKVLGDKLECDWKGLDDMIERILRTGLCPLFTINLMPMELTSGPKDYWHMKYPPKDYNLWRKFMKQWAEHLISNFGREEVRKWYFEVWNEPESKTFFEGTYEEYLKLYDYTVAGLKDADSELIVGGPASYIPGYFASFIKHCSEGQNSVTGKTGTQLNFLSFHYYAFFEPFPMLNRITSMHERIMELMGRYPDIARLPLLITEYNSWYPTADTEYNAAFVCRCVKYFSDTKRMLKLFYFLLVDSDKYGGMYKNDMGMFTYAGVPKTTYPTFKGLNKLSGWRVKVDGADEMTDALVTEDNGKITAVVWTGSDDHLEPQFPSRSVRLKFRGLKYKNYNVKCYAIDSQHSNAIDDWKKAGSPQDPSPELVEQLRKAGELEQVWERTMNVKNNEINLDLKMPLFSVYMFEMEKQ
ncbi:MAG: discoidin domain-containing protein [Elusimicrobia bacterium]|nr:discoidin domain-containing protein [Elusimicrobiota bacterium]